MASFVDEFMKKYGSQVAQQLSSNLGIQKNTAQQLIPQIAPLILSGLKKQMDTQGGAARVDHILNKYGSSDVLTNIKNAMAQKAQDTSVDAKLGGLLGNAGVQATNLLAKNFKLDSSIASKIIPMLSPILLGALTKKRDSGAGSTGIAALLDADGDGSILDDVGGFLLKNLAGGGAKSAGGGLGSLLGGLLGGRKK